MLTKHREDRLQAMLCISNTTGLWARPPLCRARATREGRTGGWEISEGTISGARWTVQNPSIGNPISLGLRKKSPLDCPLLTRPQHSTLVIPEIEKEGSAVALFFSHRKKNKLFVHPTCPPPPTWPQVCVSHLSHRARDDLITLAPA